MLTTTRVPVTMWVGTMVRTPFDSMAGLNEPDAVCPFIAGSVSTISSVTFCGISMETATPSCKARIHHHALLEIFLVIPDHVGRHLHLVESLLVHEMEAVAILIEVAEFVVFDMGTFDLVGGLVAPLGLHAVRNAAHIDLGRGSALAGMKIFRVKDDVELAVEIDDIPLAERRSDDLHDRNP